MNPPKMQVLDIYVHYFQTKYLGNFFNNSTV